MLAHSSKVKRVGEGLGNHTGLPDGGVDRLRKMYML